MPVIVERPEETEGPRDLARVRTARHSRFARAERAANLLTRIF